MKIGRAALAGALVLSCSTRERAPDEQAALGGEVAARVGGQPIPLALVAEVARAQRVSARDAARKVIDDEIAAGAARSRGLDKQQPTAWRLVATRARFVTDRLLFEAKRKGPASNEEVGKLSAVHWFEVDRPPMVRTLHALAMRPDKPQDIPAARAVAADLLVAANAATSDEDFETRTKAVPHPKGIKVVVERLPPVASDGRTTGGGGMDKRFSVGAAALVTPGATSGIVESDFGWHVIRLMDRFPGETMPFEDRRVAFTEEVFAMRSQEAATALLKGVMARNPVQVSPAAEGLMRSVPIASEQASLP